MNSRQLVLICLVVFAAVSRLVPHPPNFAPIGAMALFGGACFKDRRWAFAAPLTAMLLSDAVLGFHSLMPVVYGSFALIVWLGFWLQERRRLVPIAAASLSGSMLFFLVTNFSVWATGSFYPKTLAGLKACYVAGIPFFGNTVLGDATYCLALFGSLALAERAFPKLREAPLAAA